jgi:ABC-2 type transport system permease protein
MKLLDRFFNSRFWALVQKEIRQIMRNKQLIILLIVPPTLQLLLYGFALNPEIRHLSLGVMDYANVAESRELVAALTENQTFIVREYATSEAQLSRQVEAGKLTLGVVIPPEFRRELAQEKTAHIQVLIDGVDANSAGIASGYLNQIIRQYNRNLASAPIVPPIKTETIFLYNPGLKSSWFFVPGVTGLVLTLIATLTSSVTVVKEKDTGTLEQLLMTPAEAWEILVAKIVPLFFLLMGDVLLALTLGRLVFGVPFLGSFPLFMVLSGLYLFVGISVGILLATISQSQQQVVLTTFFINLPMVQTSGAIAPIETMPPFFQVISLLNPLRHYVKIIRGVLLKGNGLDVLYPEALALLVFAVVLLTISSNQFRNQLS